MKRYSEYEIYTMKAVSSISIIYVCFYMLSIMMFNIRLPILLFFSGVASVLCSILSMYHNKSHPAVKGVVFSLVISLSLYLWGISCLLTSISFLYSLLLWRIGWSLYNSGIRYQEYREQFITGLRILAAAIVISLFFQEKSVVSTIGRFSIIYLISSLLLLRNSRELQLKKDDDAGIINLIVNLFIVAVLLLISSDTFLSSALFVLKAAWNAIDFLLEKAIYFIGLAIGFILSPILNFLKRSIHYNGNINLNDNSPSQPLQNPVSGRILPPVIFLAIKILILLGAAAIIIRFYNSHSRKKHSRDYSEEKEFIFNMNEVSSSIKRNLSAISYKMRGVFNRRPLSDRDRIRYIYESFLEHSIKKGIYTKISETPQEIEVKASDYIKETDGIELLTNAYEKARYSKGDISKADLENAKAGYEKVKNL